MLRYTIARNYIRADDYTGDTPAVPNTDSLVIRYDCFRSPDWAFRFHTSAPGVFHHQKRDQVLLNDSDPYTEWNWTNRQTAQAILPQIYLGPFVAAKNAGFLQTHGITCVIGLHSVDTSSSTPAFSASFKAVSRAASVLDIEQHVYQIHSFQHLIATFPVLVQAINSHLQSCSASSSSTTTISEQPHQVKRILIFDETGNNYAALACAAYLVSILELIFEIDEDGNVQEVYLKVMQYIQAKRPCVFFDKPGKGILKTWGELCSARRDALCSFHEKNGLSISGMNGESKKRGFREITSAQSCREDDDMVLLDQCEEADGVDDNERFYERSFAPFVDVNESLAYR